MKIAVCDDEQQHNIKTIELINSLLTNPSGVDITTCLSGEELLSKHELSCFEIIFLDIEMGGMNGIETARKIRHIDNKVIIVFLTSYHDFALDGYEVGAFRYLIKNGPQYTYEKQFKSILDEYSQNHKQFHIPSRNSTTIVYLKDIIYFEVDNKVINVATTTDTYEFFGKLSDVEAELGNDNFIKTFKSFLINISQIKSINKNEVIMKNGSTVFLSRKFKKAVTDSYISFMSAL